jgi:epoxyqueuosine reductase QueG
MQVSELEDVIRATLLSEGAALVGFADISELPPGDREYMDNAVWIGVALDPNIVRELHNGPSKLYEVEYRFKNALIDRLSRLTAVILRQNGFQAFPRIATDERVDWDTLSTPLPHKTVGTRAGVGWIGKCGLLVTREFGSALRMGVVLTDAFFEGDVPVGTSYCGDCDECVRLCPAGAPKGLDWNKRMERDEFYDAHACQQQLKRFNAERGHSAQICGICIAACPWTKEYLKRTDRTK